MRKFYRVTIYATYIENTGGWCNNIYPQLDIIKEHGTYFDREITQPEVLQHVSVMSYDIKMQPRRICTFMFPDKESAIKLVDALSFVFPDNESFMKLFDTLTELSNDRKEERNNEK